MIEYTGELPKHVIAQLEEHTSGGFMLFRIGHEGDILSDFSFDNETSYLALVKKATSTLFALNTMDNTKAIRSLTTNFSDEDGDGYDDDDDDENDDYQENR